MLHKNWPEIAKVKNDFLRLALIAVKPEPKGSTLSSEQLGMFSEFQTLARAFPSCFGETEVPKVKLSAIDAEWKNQWDQAKKYVDDSQVMFEPGIGEILHAFGIPFIKLRWHPHQQRNPSFLDDSWKDRRPPERFTWFGNVFVIVHSHTVTGTSYWCVPAACVEVDVPAKKLELTSQSA